MNLTMWPKLEPTAVPSARRFQAKADGAGRSAVAALTASRRLRFPGWLKGKS